MKNYFEKTKVWILNNKKKFWFGLAVLAVVIYGLVRFFSPTVSTPTYVLGSVSRGMIVSTVSGTGQVSAENELALNPRVSGEVKQVLVKEGDHVKKGQTLFVLDGVDAWKQVRDADLSLKSALADYDSNISSKENAVKTAYFNYLNSNLAVVPDSDKTQNDTAPTLSGNYNLGKEGDIFLKTYNSKGGVSFTVSGLISDTGLSSNTTPQPIGNSGLFIVFPSGSISAGLSWKISIPNKNSSSYLSTYNAWQDAVSAQKEMKDTSGATLLSIQAKRNSLLDAQRNLADYSVKAPFDGVVANIGTKIGDQASSSTTLATLITPQKIITIPLNEVDISKIKIDQKTTTTFDAIEGLEITGKVVSFDLIGATTSNVVNYDVKVSLDTDDERIKSGMSANVSIATDVAGDVLMVPNSAVKKINNGAYVLVPTTDSASSGGQAVTLPATPIQAEVELGISDDLNTEIKSGLKEGDIIVTKTVSSATTTKTTSAPSLFSSTRSAGAISR